MGPRPRPPPLGSRGDWASPSLREPVAGCPVPGPPTVAGPTPANRTWEMRVAGNQGQGPGHNGAIVGLQSVDLQAAAPHPPALLPSPAPHQGVAKNHGLPRGPTRDGEGRAARCMAWSVHQVATEHRTSEVGVGGQGRAAPPLTGAGGDPALSAFSKKPGQITRFLTLHSELPEIWNLKGTSRSKRQNGRGLQHFSLMERKSQGKLSTPQVTSGGPWPSLWSGLMTRLN